MEQITRRTHPNGLEYLDIDTPLCQAHIFLQGAQIVHFQPAGKPALLWSSSANDYQPGIGIRGGIPICWPWFGMHSNPDWPQHGFARTSVWTLAASSIDADSVVELEFSLEIDAENKRYWPQHTQLSLVVRLGDCLSVSLVNTNLGDHEITLTQALHSYFPVDDIHSLRAEGFGGAEYMEFGLGPYPQVGDSVSFERETDRVYHNLGPCQLLHTDTGIIQIIREHSRSAVLWNPWVDKSRRLSRFNDHDYLSMVCLESANVLDDQVVLGPKQRHTLTTHIQWYP